MTESSGGDWASRVAAMSRRRRGVEGLKGKPINEMSPEELAAKIKAAFGASIERTTPSVLPEVEGDDPTQETALEAIHSAGWVRQFGKR